MKSYKNKSEIAIYTLKEDIDEIALICEALGSKKRLEILKLLQQHPVLSVPEIVKKTKIPTTTLIHHLNLLEKADIISIRYSSSTHGTSRIVTRNLKGVNIGIYYNDYIKNNTLIAYTQSMRVGDFVRFEGDDFNFATIDKHYHTLGDNCYLPERFEADLIYASKGMVTYFFSNEVAKLNHIVELKITLELCSEAPYYNNDYLSDITFWINDKEIMTYTSSGDYGDHIGRFNPKWWPSRNTQYGRLLTIQVNQEGVYSNGKLVNHKININDLDLNKSNKISLKIGNKPIALNIGGFNIFGKSFGDYDQDIELTLSYEHNYEN